MKGRGFLRRLVDYAAAEEREVVLGLTKSISVCWATPISQVRRRVQRRAALGQVDAHPDVAVPGWVEADEGRCGPDDAAGDDVDDLVLHRPLGHPQQRAGGVHTGKDIRPVAVAVPVEPDVYHAGRYGHSRGAGD